MDSASSRSVCTLQMAHVPTELYEIPGAAYVLIRSSQLASEDTAILDWFGRYRTVPGN
jgi:hypothetical protein